MSSRVDREKTSWFCFDGHETRQRSDKPMPIKCSAKVQIRGEWRNCPVKMRPMETVAPEVTEAPIVQNKSETAHIGGLPIIKRKRKAIRSIEKKTARKGSKK